MGNDLENLRNDIPSQYLPHNYGGELPTVEELAADFNKTWDATREFFKENANVGTDEHFRRGEPLDIDGLFGVGGSFRKLIVD